MRRQLTLLAIAYLLLSAVFAGVAALGLNGIVGTPLVVAGTGGAAGALAMVFGALYACESVREGRGIHRSVNPAGMALGARVANIGRLVILTSGLLAAVTGAYLPPAPIDGVEQSMITGLALVCGVLWAFLALATDNVGRLAKRYVPTRPKLRSPSPSPDA